MSPLTLQAPAKLNLSLRILRKREDGFHELDTIMVKLPGLHDTLEFTPASALGFACDDPSIPADESNLVMKAARAFERVSDASCDCLISLKKRIPSGAGLGGGSSDAAATLIGLNQLHGYKLGSKQLHEMAASLGSDINFFLISGAGRCHGRGEIIDAIPSPPRLNVLLLKPDFGVLTPDAYRRWKHSIEIPGVTYSQQDSGGVEIVNDLERPVFEKHRFLAEMKQWLLARDETEAALMSGSGSTMFAVLRDGADAEALASAARAELDPGLWHWAGTTGD